MLLKDEVPPSNQACFTGNVKCVELLISHNIDVNSKSFPGENSPLQWACIGGHISVVNILLEIGADINLQLNNGRTCLIEACTEDKHHIFS